MDAVLFDLDGVLTDTAALHERAWKRLLDQYFAELAHRPAPVPFSSADYRRYVDGRPRVDGLANVLASRGITLPAGRPGDGPDTTTLHGLAGRKDRYFRELIETDVPVFPATRTVLAGLRAHGVPVAVVSASRNAAAVMARTGLAHHPAARLKDAGADLVVTDLAELEVTGVPGGVRISARPGDPTPYGP